MRTVLLRLFDECSDAEALTAIREREARDALGARINATSRLDNGDPIPAGATGDNLFLGLLALRVKFPRDEALAKVELNISMRQRRGSRGC